MRIGIVGAGHAGVEAARQAGGRGAEVVLFSAEPLLPYYRPRVVLLAFERMSLDEMTMRPEHWYAEHGIDLRLESPVRHIDAQSRTVTARGQEERFDALIIATGAGPVLLPFVGKFPEHVFPIWRAEDSLTIQRRLEGTERLVILGGGISGIEAAVYGRDLGLDVSVIEKAPHVMAQQLGSNAGRLLANNLEQKGIHLRITRIVTDVSKAGHELKMTLDNAEELRCDLVLTTVGAKRNTSMFAEAGLRTDAGVVVDEYQRTSAPGVFACGDIAQRNGVRTASVVRAADQGRGAAANALATLTGGDLEKIADRTVPLSFKHGDIEFHAVGPPPGEGFEEKTLSAGGEGIYRSVVLESGTLRGVQMVGSREGFRQLADSLGRPWQAIASQLPASDSGPVGAA